MPKLHNFPKLIFQIVNTRYLSLGLVKWKRTLQELSNFDFVHSSSWFRFFNGGETFFRYQFATECLKFTFVNVYSIPVSYFQNFPFIKQNFSHLFILITDQYPCAETLVWTVNLHNIKLKYNLLRMLDVYFYVCQSRSIIFPTIDVWRAAVCVRSIPINMNCMNEKLIYSPIEQYSGAKPRVMELPV